MEILCGVSRVFRKQSGSWWAGAWVQSGWVSAVQSIIKWSRSSITKVLVSNTKPPKLISTHQDMCVSVKSLHLIVFLLFWLPALTICSLLCLWRKLTVYEPLSSHAINIYTAYLWAVKSNISIVVGALGFVWLWLKSLAVILLFPWWNVMLLAVSHLGLFDICMYGTVNHKKHFRWLLTKTGL